ncbi:MAG TPA: hypothetical protein VH142_12910 [Polyangiaceae bacterium]|nr:hypothetical protein [Polyangiaceae bacterium]
MSPLSVATMTSDPIRFRTLCFCATLLGSVSTLGGCAAHAGPSPKTAAAADGAVQAAPVTDATFAPTIAGLLREKQPEPERISKLAGVVQYQLGRAGALFDSGHEEAGLEAVEGALYLIRSGEFHPSMIANQTAPVLEAANAVARSGNEGRALALYSMLDRVLPVGAERTEVEGHLAAITSWEQTTRSQGPLEAAGGDEQSASDRALWDPSPDSVKAARAAILEWIDRAVGYSKEQIPPTEEERDEAFEAYRAIRTGAETLAALYLRNGNPAGALEAMEGPNVARVVPPRLHETLRHAAEDDDPAAWLELFTTFERLGTTDADVTIDPELAQAAAWGAAVELCRVEPKTIRGVMPISTLLLRHGMAEAAPLLLAPVVEGTTHAEVAQWALAYVLEALSNHDAVGDVSAAKRTFEQAKPLLDSIDAKPLAKSVNPSVARVRFAMGALEARAGDLTAALPLVQTAAKSEPSPPTLELLAAIDRQRGNVKEALASLDTVATLAMQASDPAQVADARLSEFQMYRDSGDQADAAKSLEVALRRALDARQLAQTGADQAGAERTLARVLEEYGALDGARRATQRAYDAAHNDLRQLTATVLDAGRRGLTRSDLKASRDAARRGIEANLPASDLVYVALWLRLLERRLGAPSDGTVEEALGTIDDDAGWPARLRSWCTGRLTDEQLFAAARDRSEQTEATFYAAMAAFVANDARALSRLEQVAHSESIELVEVAMARDLVAETKHLTFKLPDNVDIP